MPTTLSRDLYVLGKEINAFEEEFEAYLGDKEVLCMFRQRTRRLNSGIPDITLRVDPREVVIIQANTYVTAIPVSIGLDEFLELEFPQNSG